MTSIQHTWYMTVRLLRNLMRQPWYIAFTLIQPIIYLVMFSQLFHKVINIPGFGSKSYITFLTPGIVIMSAIFGGGWSGMGMLNDLDRGVLDRFLVTPASRTSLVVGRLLQLAIVTVIQSVIVVLIGLLIGARYPGGVAGVIALIVSAILLAAPFGALSCGMSLIARQEESVIAASNFILLPLTFLSSTFMAQNLMPNWMQAIARFNPVNWAVIAGREAIGTDPHWGVVLTQGGYLILLGVVATWLALLAFRSYQASV